MDYVKSYDARYVWTLTDDAILEETGPNSLRCVIGGNVLDTEILLRLLKRNETYIHQMANKERVKLFGKGEGTEC